MNDNDLIRIRNLFHFRNFHRCRFFLHKLHNFIKRNSCLLVLPGENHFETKLQGSVEQSGRDKQIKRVDENKPRSAFQSLRASRTSKARNGNHLVQAAGNVGWSKATTQTTTNPPHIISAHMTAANDAKLESEV
jgi:hypothetical protein